MWPIRILRRSALPPLIALTVVAACGGRGSSSTGPATVQSARVVTIGDSITEGNNPGLPPYPTYLEAMLRARNPAAQVINRGRGGQRTSGGIGTLSRSLPVDRPGFVCIMEGTNDVRGFAPDAAENLRQMVRLAKAANAVPILATIPPQFGPASDFMDDVIELNILIRQVAAQEGATLADVFSALLHESYFVSDGFHPNDNGNRTIAQVFDNALAIAGFPVAQTARQSR